MVSWKSHTRGTFADHLSLPSRARLGAIFHPRREKKARETWDRLNHIHSAQQPEYSTPIHSSSDPETFVYIDATWGTEQVPRRAARGHSGQTRVYAPPSHQQQNTQYASYQPQPPPPQNLHYAQAYHHQPQHVHVQQPYYGLPQQPNATQHASHRSPPQPYATQHTTHRAPQHGKKRPRENKKRKERKEPDPKAGYGRHPSGPSAAEVMLAGGYTTSLMERYPHRALY
ncbi:hypothetical protein CPB85DRAFT_1441246 [Mucidula mucida]|nr:hypothetical protein CPB85DRAFT_1441246 [Mucidula mucida]